MNISINELKETLELQWDTMYGNKQSTNDIIVEEILAYIGYDFRRNKDVHKMYGQNIDWNISINNDNIAVIVVALGDELDKSNLDELISKVDTECSAIIVTDGQYIVVFRELNKVRHYISKINIKDELDDNTLNIIKALSKDGYNMKYFDNIIKDRELTSDKVKKAIKDNINVITDSILVIIKNELSDKYEMSNDNIEICRSSICDFINDDKNSNNTNIECEIAEDDDNTAFNKIKELKIEVEKLKESLRNKDEEISRLNTDINKLCNKDKDEALELLNMIANDESKERTYVAVINKEIIQFDSLHTFVGRVLQKLFELKNFEAINYIQNGDIFRLNSTNPKYIDMIINTHKYDIVISNRDEDDALSKLRVIFSHFKDIIFECKKIGTLKMQDDIGIDSVDDIELVLSEESDDSDDSAAENIDNNEDDSNIIDSSNDIDEDSIFVDDIEDNTDTEDTVTDCENIESDNIEWVSEDAEDIFNDSTDNMQEVEKKFIVGQLQNIDNILDNSDLEIHNIKYIGNNTTTYKIAITKQEQALEQITCKALDAVLALSIFEYDQLLRNLKLLKLNNTNSSIVEYSNEYKGHIKLTGTNYTPSLVKSYKDVLRILYDICAELDIDMSEIFIYMEAKATSNDIDDYSFDESIIQLNDSGNYISSKDIKTATSIIKGDILNNVLITKNSLSIQKDVIISADAVKTKYLSRTISNIGDVADIICQMITEAVNQNIDIDINQFGNVLGTDYKIMSYNKNDVSSNNIEVKVLNTETAYISYMETWQIIYALVKIHSYLFNNGSIAIRTYINADAVNFYGGEFETAEPSLALAVGSFANYIAESIK